MREQRFLQCLRLSDVLGSLAALVPPSRISRYRYFGVLA